jgi:hypothetical protein
MTLLVIIVAVALVFDYTTGEASASFRGEASAFGSGRLQNVARPQGVVLAFVDAPGTGEPSPDGPRVPQAGPLAFWREAGRDLVLSQWSASAPGSAPYSSALTRRT